VGGAVRAEALRASRLYPVNYKIAPSMLPNKRIGVFNTSLTLILSELAILA
jgi:hypothetical protein